MARRSGNSGHHMHLVSLHERWRARCARCGQEELLQKAPDGRGVCKPCLQGRRAATPPAALTPVYRSSTDLPYGSAGRRAARGEMTQRRPVQPQQQSPSPPAPAKPSIRKSLRKIIQPQQRASPPIPPPKPLPKESDVSPRAEPDQAWLLRRTVIEKARLLWEDEQAKKQEKRMHP